MDELNDVWYFLFFIFYSLFPCEVPCVQGNYMYLGSRVCVWCVMILEVGEVCRCATRRK